ncbi:hypothetical protein RF11_09569 [Thelohanellus kitauei]|uniref:Uncharacterized protein n=1 Tax=Thelohanellus kitauei TaxID=669202 RepID=A0A0C2N7C4_THEKT|nr:hypothetical protein RF11_09569 [Thelohanellus kitauei]
MFYILQSAFLNAKIGTFMLIVENKEPRDKKIDCFEMHYDIGDPAVSEIMMVKESGSQLFSSVILVLKYRRIEGVFVKGIPKLRFLNLESGAPCGQLKAYAGFCIQYREG